MNMRRLILIVAVAAICGCSKKETPSPSLGLHISPNPAGAEPIVFSIILTNAQPPPMRCVIGIYKNLNFEWHKVADDGSQTTIRGVVPTNIFVGVMSEWRTMTGRTGVDPAREEAVYVASLDAKHPPQVQRLLDYLSK
jgi:hypothetical protein